MSDLTHPATAVPAAPLPAPGGRPGTTLALIATAYLMVGLDATVVNIALPKIQDALGFSPVGLSWVINSYTLAFGGLLLLGGRLGDILGKRRMLVAGTALFTVSSLAGGLAGGPGLLVAARVGQGVGAAMASPNTLALIATNFAEGPPRNRALAVYSATAGAGASVGLVLGGVLTDWAGWRAVMFVNVPLGIAVVLGAPRYVREPEHRRVPVDLGGTVTATAGTTALVYGFVRAAGGWGDPLTVACLAAGAVLLAAFAAVESRTAQPMVPLRLFRSRDRSAAYLAVLLLTATMTGLFFFLSQFVQDVLRFGPARAGLAFLPMTLAMFLTVSRVPRLLPRFGAGPLMVAGATLMTATMVWLARIGTGCGYLGAVFGPLLVFGVGMGLSFMPLNATVLTGVAREDSGSAAGVLQTLMQQGGSLGLAVLVTVSGAASRAAEGRPPGAPAAEQARYAFVHGLRSAFTAGTVLAVLALAVSVYVVARGSTAAPGDG